MGRWDITGLWLMNNKDELSEIVFVNSINSSFNNCDPACDCSDPGTGADTCTCEDSDWPI